MTWFQVLVARDDTIALVDDTNGEIGGFVIARLQEAPPVYAPGGPVCLIDDFCVALESAWGSLGAELLTAVQREARERCAVVSIVVCPHLGAAKRALLAESGFEITTEWHVRHL